MRLLVIHQNFPGQFRHLLAAWARQPGWDILGIGRDTAPGTDAVRWLRYRLHRSPLKEQHSYLRTMEAAVLHGQAVARVLLKLKKEGYRPDTILAHPGWGETLYAKDVFPDARLVHYCEWFYGTPDGDSNFDPEFPFTFDNSLRERTRNALHLLNLTNCDQGVSPTQWQKSRYPEIFHPKIEVLHEGIPAQLLKPDPEASFTTPNGITLKAGDPVVTFVARNLEPYRGFHIFMRALERIQKEHPRCHAVIVGGDDVSYGSPPPRDAKASNWREYMLRQVSIDPARTHFLGKVSYADYVKVLQISAVHVYLTYPFVLSWSLLEAAVLGCPLVASDTAPVREFLAPMKRMRLVDFFNADRVGATVLEFLEHVGEPDADSQKMRSQLRCRIQVKGGDYVSLLIERSFGSIGQVSASEAMSKKTRT